MAKTLAQIAKQNADKLINAQLTPLTQEQKSAGVTAAGQQRWLSTLGASYQAAIKNALAGAPGSAKDAVDKLLAGAAGEFTANDAESNARNDALRRTLGSDVMTGGPDYLHATGNAAAAQRTTQFAGGGQAQLDWLGRSGVVGKGAQTLAQQQARENYTKALTDIANRKSQVRANYPAAFQQALQSERQWYLDKQGLQLSRDQFGLGAANAAADNARQDRALGDSEAAAAAAAGAKKGPFGLSDKVWATVQKLHDTYFHQKDGKIQVGQWETKDVIDASGNHTQTQVWHPVKNPWRTMFAELIGQAGANRDQAAKLATTWLPQSIKTSDAYHIRQMLKNRGVSAKTQRIIIINFFGRDAWATSNQPSRNHPYSDGAVTSSSQTSNVPTTTTVSNGVSTTIAAP